MLTSPALPSVERVKRDELTANVIDFSGTHEQFFAF